jgi:hypothetical protein
LRTKTASMPPNKYKPYLDKIANDELELTRNLLKYRDTKNHEYKSKLKMIKQDEIAFTSFLTHGGDVDISRT